MQEINYHELWELEQPTQRPHKRRADELGIRVTDIPVSPVLTRLKESIRRIEELYNIRELLEEGINVDELLNQFTEFQLIAYIEELGFEHSIALAEIEALVSSQEWTALIDIPFIRRDFFVLRQFEESANGGLIDVSAFNTMDFIRGNDDWEFDKYKYFTDKVAEKSKDLAIMHSCISGKEEREIIRKRFDSLVNGKFANSAVRLISMIKETTDLGRLAELTDRLQEKNSQIRRLNEIWNKHAYQP